MSLVKKNQTGNSQCQVTFSLPVEITNGAKSIQVLGDFNGWNPQQAPEMKKVKNTYSAQLQLETGAVYQFRYLLDGQTWINDAQADRYVAGPFGAENGVVDLTVTGKTAQAVEKAKKAPAAKSEKALEGKAATAPATKPAAKAKKAASSK